MKAWDCWNDEGFNYLKVWGIKKENINIKRGIE
jgi:hypothetical protein